MSKSFSSDLSADRQAPDFGLPALGSKVSIKITEEPKIINSGLPGPVPGSLSICKNSNK